MKEMPQDNRPGKDCRSCDYRRRVGDHWFGARLPRAIGGKCCYKGLCDYASQLTELWAKEKP